MLGLAGGFGEAFLKAQEATQSPLPVEGTVLITVATRDREGVVEIARQFDQLGFKILATRGTAAWLAGQGIASQPVNKLQEGRPNIVDFIMNRQIHLLITTPAGKESELADSLQDYHAGIG